MDFRGSEFFGDALIRAAYFSNSALFDYCTFHGVVQMVNTKADWKIKMNFCTFHAFTDLSETDSTFELYRSQIGKNDEAKYSRPPKGWYIKDDGSEDFAIFGSREMDELEKERDERGHLKAAKAAENGSAKDQGEAGHMGNDEVTQPAADGAAHVGEDESATGGPSS